jgi:hypothetical protein
MDEEVAKMRLTEEYKNYEEKDVYLVYLDEGSAKARRFNEQDGKVSTKQSIRSGSNQRGRRNSDSDRAQLNQALEEEVYCEVCGSTTHRHRDCGVKWENRSTADRPEFDMFKMASLPASVFDTTWQSACSKGCLKNVDEATRARQKARYMDQRARNAQQREAFNADRKSRDSQRTTGYDRNKRENSRSTDREKSAERGSRYYDQQPDRRNDRNDRQRNYDRDYDRTRSRSPSIPRGDKRDYDKYKPRSTEPRKVRVDTPTAANDKTESERDEPSN